MLHLNFMMARISRTRSISYTMPNLAHKLASRPALVGNIPKLPDDELIRIKNKSFKKVFERPPSLDAEMKAAYGPQDLRRWPRENKTQREITRQAMLNAADCYEVERIFDKKKNVLHWDDIFFGLNLILTKAKSENQLKEILHSRHFWEDLTLYNRFMWRIAPRTQAKMLETFAHFGVQSSSTFDASQVILKEAFNKKKITGEDIGNILFAYEKSGFIKHFKGFHLHIEEKAKLGPLVLKKGWNDTKSIAKAIYSLSTSFTAPALSAQLATAALALKDSWNDAPIRRLSLTSESFVRAKAHTPELIEMFAAASLNKIGEADAIQLTQLSNAFKLTRSRISDVKFDLAIKNRFEELMDSMKVREFVQVTNYLLSRELIDDKLKERLSALSESFIEDIYDNFALVDIVKLNAISQNDKGKLYRKAVNSSIPFLPCFTALEIADFVMALNISKAPVTKVFPKIGSIMRSQIKDSVLNNQVYNTYAVAKTLAAFINSNVDHEKLYDAASKSLKLSIDNHNNKIMENLEIENTIKLIGAFVAGGKAKIYSEILLETMNHPSISQSKSPLLYQAYLCMKAEGIDVSKLASIQSVEIPTKQNSKNYNKIISFLEKSGLKLNYNEKVKDGYNVDISIPSSKTALLVTNIKVLNSYLNLDVHIKEKHLKLLGYKVIVIDGVKYNEKDNAELLKNINSK